MQRNMGMEELGAAITRAASLQTYMTVRLLVDRDRRPDAYLAYAYFRWVDDWLDEPARQASERLAFSQRQSELIAACYRREPVKTECAEEDILLALVRKDSELNSGLQSYIRNMMSVMTFDAERRGRLISSNELDQYALRLSTAVTEALHYFIGHSSRSPYGPSRYLAAEGAHITHMLRDTVEDSELGYFNIPREYLKANGISPCDLHSEAYRAWVRSRVKLARSYFRAGRAYLAQVPNLRCRLAGYAYMARFQTVLDSIERDGYLLKDGYREAKGPKAGAQMGWLIFRSAFNDHNPSVETGA